MADAHSDASHSSSACPCSSSVGDSHRLQSAISPSPASQIGQGDMLRPNQTFSFSSSCALSSTSSPELFAGAPLTGAFPASLHSSTNQDADPPGRPVRGDGASSPPHITNASTRKAPASLIMGAAKRDAARTKASIPVETEVELAAAAAVSTDGSGKCAVVTASGSKYRDMEVRDDDDDAGSVIPRAPAMTVAGGAPSREITAIAIDRDEATAHDIHMLHETRKLQKVTSRRRQLLKAGTIAVAVDCFLLGGNALLRLMYGVDSTGLDSFSFATAAGLGTYILPLVRALIMIYCLSPFERSFAFLPTFFRTARSLCRRSYHRATTLFFGLNTNNASAGSLPHPLSSQAYAAVQSRVSALLSGAAMAPLERGNEEGASYSYTVPLNADSTLPHRRGSEYIAASDSVPDDKHNARTNSPVVGSSKKKMHTHTVQGPSDGATAAPTSGALLVTGSTSYRSSCSTKTNTTRFFSETSQDHQPLLTGGDIATVVTGPDIQSVRREATPTRVVAQADTRERGGGGGFGDTPAILAEAQVALDAIQEFKEAASTRASTYKQRTNHAYRLLLLCFLGGSLRAINFKPPARHPPPHLLHTTNSHSLSASSLLIISCSPFFWTPHRQQQQEQQEEQPEFHQVHLQEDRQSRDQHQTTPASQMMLVENVTNAPYHNNSQERQSFQTYLRSYNSVPQYNRFKGGAPADSIADIPNNNKTTATAPVATTPLLPLVPPTVDVSSAVPAAANDPGERGERGLPPVVSEGSGLSFDTTAPVAKSPAADQVTKGVPAEKKNSLSVVEAESTILWTWVMFFFVLEAAWGVAVPFIDAILLWKLQRCVREERSVLQKCVVLATARYESVLLWQHPELVVEDEQEEQEQGHGQRQQQKHYYHHYHHPGMAVLDSSRGGVAKNIKEERGVVAVVDGACGGDGGVGGGGGVGVGGGDAASSRRALAGTARLERDEEQEDKRGRIMNRRQRCPYAAAAGAGAASAEGAVLTFPPSGRRQAAAAATATQTRASSGGHLHGEEKEEKEEDEEGEDDADWFELLKLLRPYFWPSGRDVGRASESTISSSSSLWQSPAILRLLAISTFFTIACSKTLTLLSPLLIGTAADAAAHAAAAAAAHDHQAALAYGKKAAQWVAAYAAASWGADFFKEAQSIAYVKVQQAASVEISALTLRHVLALHLEWHTKKQMGHVVRVIDRGTEGCASLMTYCILYLGPVFVECIAVCLVFLFHLKHQVLASLLFVSVTFYAWLTLRVTVWRRKWREKQNRSDSTFHQLVVDALTNFETVKIFNAEDFEVRRYMAAVEEYQTVGTKIQMSLSFLNLSQRTVVCATLVCGLIFVSQAMAEGTMGVSEFVTAQMYFVNVFAPLNFLGSIYHVIVRSAIDVRALYHLLRTKPGIVDAPNAISLVDVLAGRLPPSSSSSSSSFSSASAGGSAATSSASEYGGEEQEAAAGPGAAAAGGSVGYALAPPFESDEDTVRQSQQQQRKQQQDQQQQEKQEKQKKEQQKQRHQQQQKKKEQEEEHKEQGTRNESSSSVSLGVCTPDAAAAAVVVGGGRGREERDDGYIKQEKEEEEVYDGGIEENSGSRHSRSSSRRRTKKTAATTGVVLSDCGGREEAQYLLAEEKEKEERGGGGGGAAADHFHGRAGGGRGGQWLAWRASVSHAQSTQDEEEATATATATATTAAAETARRESDIRRAGEREARERGRGRGEEERGGRRIRREERGGHIVGGTVTAMRAPCVEFVNVCFSYAGRRNLKGSLRNIRLTVQPGTTCGLVGPSGSGKSTLMKLLLRLLEPQRGRILIDGADISMVTQDSLRRCMGMVPQDAVMFNASIYENIAYANRQASSSDVEAAAEAAQLLPLIRSMKEGWNTLVGERGLKLSGGERQRVAIARCLLRNPPLVLLDEATSSLDSLSEAAIQKALLKLSSSRTVLMIAHRLSTVMHADLICVVNDGVIVEQGTHAKLLAAGGAYANLWRAQARGETLSL